MDSEHIDALLNKYWNGETSLEEEQQLKTHFRDAPVAEQHKEAAALFRYFDEHRNKALADPSFDKKVLGQMKPGKTVSLLIYNTMRFAAGIIVVVLAVWLVQMEVRKATPGEMADTYDDPKMAFEETKRALLMISRSFGKAEAQAKKINLFNEAQKDIRKESVESEL